jgi:hypothetical protein
MAAAKKQVQYKGRPAVIFTAPKVGATGREMVGVRFTDVEQFVPCPGFEGILMPAPNSTAIAAVEDLQEA